MRLSPVAIAISVLFPLLAAAQPERANETVSFEKDPLLLWGTYAPQLYFAVRPQLPKSLVNGLMWFGLDDWAGLQRIHHTASSSPPHESGLASYTYTSYLPRVGSTQNLVDSRNGFNLLTSFANLGDYGDEWGARIEAQGIKGTERASGVWYIALEGPGSLKLVEQEGQENGLESPIVLLGNTPDLGSFRITLTDHEDSKPITTGSKSSLFASQHGKTSWAGVSIPSASTWKAKDIVASLISQSAQKLISKYATSQPPKAEDLPDQAWVFGSNLGNVLQAGVLGDANFWAFQKSWEGKGGWDVKYESGEFDEEESRAIEEGDKEGKDPEITDALSKLARAYAAHFTSSLALPPPSSSSPYSSPAYHAFAQEVTSNLLGGIGYFHGKSLIDRTFAHEYDEAPEEVEEGEDGVRETGEMELLTATPSRSFFPRGFYWDEGFHLQIVGELDNDLSLEILKSWIDLIDEDGWVGREQILGEEARSKVPSEFQVQYPTYANPPTLIMAVTSLISRLNAAQETALLNSQLGITPPFSPPGTTTPSSSRYLDSPPLALSYLRSIYPALRRHYLWFRRTQTAKHLLKPYDRSPPSRQEAYRWRGRTEHHVLTSGLDDYPRAVPPSEGELHVDLHSWMGFFARTMGEVAEFLGEEEDLEEYKRNEKNILANLDALHWSEEDEMYCDVTVDEDEETIPVCHAGYISLFPMLLGLLPPDSPNLGPIFDLVHDPSKLWSPYGIRSLSKDHALFGKGENYWRGPVWMPFNYLALSSLYKFYMPTPGPHQARAKEIYTELRDNIINNIFNEYQRTGYVWEQYDPLTGQGSRSHPFTGWTSLVALIMAEKY